MGSSCPDSFVLNSFSFVLLSDRSAVRTVANFMVTLRWLSDSVVSCVCSGSRLGNGNGVGELDPSYSSLVRSSLNFNLLVCSAFEFLLDDCPRWLWESVYQNVIEAGTNASRSGEQ